MQTNKILRYIIVAGIFLLPFICLFVANHLYFPFITGKNFTFRIIVEIIFGLWLILALRDRSALPKVSKLFWAFVVFLVLIFVSDLLSPNILKSFWSNYERMEGFVTLAHLFALFVVASSVMTRKLWKWLFRTSIFVSLILFIYGCYQLAGVAAIHQGATRIDTTIGNSAYLGGYMLFHVFIALYLFFDYFSLRSKGEQKPNMFWPIFYGVAVVADVFTLFETATRGAEMGLIIGLLCFGLALVIFEKKNKMLRYAGATILGIIILSGGLFVLERNSSFVTSHESLSRLAAFTDQVLTFNTNVVCQGELKSRCLLWPMAWQGVKERPILGWGQESFNYVFNKYYDPAMYSQEQWFDRTHNVFFDWLIAGGFLGLFAYLSLYVLALYYVWRKGSPFSTLEKSFVTGLFVGYFCHNLTVFDNLTSYILFFLVLGWIQTLSGTVPETLAKKMSRWSTDVKNYLLVPVVSVGLVLVIYVVNVPGLLAASDLIYALSPAPGGPTDNLNYFKQALAYNSFGDSEIREQLVQTTTQAVTVSGLDNTVKQAFVDLTRTEMQRQLAATPQDARYFLFAGSFFAGIGDTANAIPDLLKAHELSPKKQTILFSLGSAYLGAQKYTEAVATMKEAYDLDHSFDEARKMYAIALIYGHQMPAAVEVLKSIDPGSILGDERFLQAEFASGYYSQALASINFLVKKDPNNFEYYFNRAAIESKLGNFSDAIADLTKTAQLNPASKAQVDQYIARLMTGKGM